MTGMVANSVLTGRALQRDRHAIPRGRKKRIAFRACLLVLRDNSQERPRIHLDDEINISKSSSESSRGLSRLIRYHWAVYPLEQKQFQDELFL